MVTKNLFQTMNKISMNPIMNAPMSKGRVYEQSLEKYFELTEQEDLAKLVANIRHAENHDERRNLKANLPFRCPHYFRFKDNRRSQASIIPEAFTWQTCVQSGFDHPRGIHLADLCRYRRCQSGGRSHHSRVPS